MGRIFRSPESKKDYLAIWHYIAHDNRAAADRIIDAFDEQLLKVVDHPGRGASRDDIAPGLQSVRVERYLLFYFPVKGGIKLARVLHGAMNLRREFKKSM